jgi:hypothetical protein
VAWQESVRAHGGAISIDKTGQPCYNGFHIAVFITLKSNQSQFANGLAQTVAVALSGKQGQGPCTRTFLICSAVLALSGSSRSGSDSPIVIQYVWSEPETARGKVRPPIVPPASDDRALHSGSADRPTKGGATKTTDCNKKK